MSDPDPPRANLPVPVDPAVDGAPGAAGPGGFTEFAAHVLGQPGQKRGLRGGRETLKAARSVYLETEYSGTADRRPPKGLIKKREI